MTRRLTVVGGYDGRLATPVRDWASDGQPNWVSQRGSDARAWDRREMRDVLGAPHEFAASTDCLVTNGILSYWVGNQGMPAFLNVSRVQDGIWREVGTLFLSESYSSTDVLEGVRLDAVTGERATAVLSVRNLGDVAVTLLRGEAMLRVTHGGQGTTRTLAGRYAGWWGGPPARRLEAAGVWPGAFGRGLMLGAGGMARYAWPPGQPASRWAVGLHWLPAANSTSQADNALFSLQDSSGADVGTVTYEGSSRTVRWIQDAITLSSPALSFAAGQAVFVGCGFSSAGRRLVTQGAEVPTVVFDGVISPGTTDYAYTQVSFGTSGGSVAQQAYGINPYGTNPYGGSTLAGGLGLGFSQLDNAMIFDGPLTDAEMAALGASQTALGGLPSPEGRLIWYCPWDSVPAPSGSSFAGGMRYETATQDGTDRAADPHGLTRALAVRRASSARTGLGLMQTGYTWDVAAIVATTDDGDDLADQHAQFASNFSQRVMVS